MFFHLFLFLGFNQHLFYFVFYSNQAANIFLPFMHWRAVNNSKSFNINYQSYFLSVFNQNSNFELDYHLIELNTLICIWIKLGDFDLSF